MADPVRTKLNEAKWVNGRYTPTRAPKSECLNEFYTNKIVSMHRDIALFTVVSVICYIMTYCIVFLMLPNAIPVCDNYTDCLLAVNESCAGLDQTSFVWDYLHAWPLKLMGSSGRESAERDLHFLVLEDTGRGDDP